MSNVMNESVLTFLRFLQKPNVINRLTYKNQLIVAASSCDSNNAQILYNHPIKNR